MTSASPAFHVSRRRFLQSAAAVGVGFVGLRELLYRHPSTGLALAASPEVGFGPLKTDPRGILDLPEGFTYTVISRVGDRMDDGLLVPGDHDGMAAFAGPNGRTVLVRNHELSPGQVDEGPFGPNNELLGGVAREKLFDYGGGQAPCLGGTTTLVFNTQTQQLERHFLSLAGTIRNCAGGPTPWGSWISCEENVQRANEEFEQDHGWCFEVPADPYGGLVDPDPIRPMGRFYREAVAVLPRSGIVYQTEDLHDGIIYRYLPNDPTDLQAGGRQQALCIVDQPGVDTRNWEGITIEPGSRVKTRWIDLDGLDNPDNDLRYRGREAGAAMFARGEGMWYGEVDGQHSVFWACTSGGLAQIGQVWRYTPSPYEGTDREAEAPGTLELYIEPNNAKLLEHADNLTVSPWGDLVICEDGKDRQFLVGVTPSGDLYHLAHNAVSTSELAGACFSPDGSTLFANIQAQGLTLAITGPFPRRA